MVRVVVGVDWSPESVAALELAAQEASWRSAELEIVHVYPPPVVIERHQAHAWSDALLWPGVAPASDMPGGRYERVVDAARNEALARLRGFASSVGFDPDAVGLTVVAGRRPAAVLVRIAETADLLVLGSSRRRGVAGILTGSVGQRCARQAPCPVLIAEDLPVAV